MRTPDYTEYSPVDPHSLLEGFLNLEKGFPKGPRAHGSYTVGGEVHPFDELTDPIPPEAGEFIFVDSGDVAGPPVEVKGKMYIPRHEHVRGLPRRNGIPVFLEPA